MDFVEFKNAVIAKAAEMGLEEYELYYQAGESTSVSAFRQELNQFKASNEGGVCFRCIVNGKMGYASTEELSAAQAAAIVERAADNAAVLETQEAVFLAPGGQSYRQPEQKPYALPETDELIATTLDTQKLMYQADPAVVDGSSTQGIAERSVIAICNSKGLDLFTQIHVSGLVAAAVVSNGTEKANHYQIRLGKLDQLDRQELTRAAVQGALEKLGGEAAPTGNYPVVFSPEAMSDLLDTFSSVFSSEIAQKGLSKLADKEGTVIASELVTLVDDPCHPDNPMPMWFDAEGSPTCCKNVIEKGVLKTLLYNLKTAGVAGVQTTGNASKANYDSPVAVQPFTLYLAPGALTEKALLEQAGDGVYINALSGLHAGANPVTGDFSLQSAGFLIRNGEKTVPVKSFTVAGNFFELLKNIVAVADNTKLPAPMGMNAYGAPSVLVENLSVAGK